MSEQDRIEHDLLVEMELAADYEFSIERNKSINLRSRSKFYLARQDETHLFEPSEIDG